MRLFLDRCVGSAPFVASGLGRILIGRLQAIFMPTQVASELRNSGVEMSVYSVENQPHRVVTQPIVLTTVLERQTDRAEDLLTLGAKGVLPNGEMVSSL